MPIQIFQVSAATPDFAHKNLKEISLTHLYEEQNNIVNRKRLGRWLGGLTGFIDGGFDVAAVLAIMGIIATAIVGTSIFLTPVGWAIALSALLLTLAGAFLGSYMYVRVYEDKEQTAEEKALRML